MQPRRRYEDADDWQRGAVACAASRQYAQPQADASRQAAPTRSTPSARASSARDAGDAPPAAQAATRSSRPSSGTISPRTRWRKRFGDRKVVKGASLYVRRGEAVGLLGPNGAGKTTIFYMITGLITADRGRIELDGHDVTALPMYQRARLGIGYLPQEASIFRGLNVEDNIRAVLEVVEPNKKRRERDLDALLEEFNIAQAAQDAVDRAVRRRAPALSRSPARWRRGRTTCCSTSRSPASIRSRSATFRRWCAT